MKDTSNSPSLLTSSLIVSEEKKACLSNVVEVFQEQSEDSQDYQQISTLLQLHDRLSHLLPTVNDDSNDDNEANKIHESISKYFSQLRLQTQDDDKSQVEKEKETSFKKQLLIYLAMEADLYRAMALTSIYLMEMIPMATNRPLDVSVEQGLKSCHQRAQWLVKMLNHRVAEVLLDSNHPGESVESSNLLELYATEYSEQLEGWLLECGDPFEGEDDNNNMLISFEKEQLQLEEDELLHMASTPTPNETTKHDSVTTLPSTKSTTPDSALLSARLLIQEDATTSTSTSTITITTTTAENDSTHNNNIKTSQYSTLVVLNDRGVFRSQHPQEQAWWWALTSESSVQCDANQMISISAVFSNRPTLHGRPLTIQLQVTNAKDLSLWWTRISKIVQSLQEANDLQNELPSLWPLNEVQAKLQQARSFILSPN